MASGVLYLIPSPLGETPLDRTQPEEVHRIVAGLDTFIVERPKTARAFLKQIGTTTPLQQLTLLELNEHTPAAELPALLAPLLAGTDVGLLSEAGCPAVADPGANLVRLAHQQGITVRPLVGPSSILLALMASGLVGQRFAFHGYLPVKPDERGRALHELEQRSAREDAAQAFIETPYRNRAMLEEIVKTCHAETWLVLACDLTTDREMIISRRVQAWKHALPEVDRRPCVFLLWREG